MGEELLPAEQSFAQPEKTDRSQWFCKDVCELVFRSDGFDVDHARLKVFAEPMVLDGDAL